MADVKLRNRLQSPYCLIANLQGPASDAGMGDTSRIVQR